MKLFKKWFLIICMILIRFDCVIGQTYPIPGAIQQPAWVFPVFIEDAIGQKDTLYFGYDGTNATQYHCWDDSLFNESLNYIDLMDTIPMQPFICYFAPDSMSQVDVNNFSLSQTYIIYFNAAYYPVKFKWDKQLLYHDSIPFPDQSPLPKAEILVDWFYFPNSPDSFNCFSGPILITDTCSIACCKSDSMIFNSSTGLTGPYGTQFTFTFRSWTGQIVGINELEEKKTEFIFPNPASNFEKVTINSSEMYSYGILKSIDGKIIETYEIINNQLSLKSYSAGIYFLDVWDGISNSKVFKIAVY